MMLERGRERVSQAMINCDPQIYTSVFLHKINPLTVHTLLQLWQASNVRAVARLFKKWIHGVFLTRDGDCRLWLRLKLWLKSHVPVTWDLMRIYFQKPWDSAMTFLYLNVCSCTIKHPGWTMSSFSQHIETHPDRSVAFEKLSLALCIVRIYCFLYVLVS